MSIKHSKHSIRFSTAAAGLLAMLVLTGCGTVEPAMTADQMPLEQARIVTFVPGDELEFRFMDNPELDDEQMVRPDGMVSLHLVGDMLAEGKTPVQLRDDLRAKYSEELKDPQIAVIVRKLYHRRIFVGGEVNRAGVISMPGPMTALEAIMQAGGFRLKTAHFENVLVIRSVEGKRVGCALNMEPMLTGQHVDDFFLAPEDIVFVPRTKIVKVNQWVEQYINRIVPRLGVSYGTDGDWNVSR